jgi:UDP-N-acetylmuramoyl-tripeptide--D-alanyl-D-alanine ligase
MKHTFKTLVVKILTWEAKAVLKKHKPKIVAITGTVGKTSTKDAIYTVLASTFLTRRSEKSYNNQIGIALTILGCKSGFSSPYAWTKNIIEGFLHVIFPYKYPEWLVLEVGAGEPGDIEHVSHWLKPDITVITRFSDVPAHVEFFPSIDDLIREKGYLAQELKPHGIFVFNHDDNRIRDFSEIIQRQKITYGFEPGANVEGSDETFTYGPYDNSNIEFPNGLAFSVRYNNTTIPVSLHGALGKQHMYPMLAAFAVGTALHIDPAKIAEALGNHVTPNGRMKLLAGIKDTLLIDDSYNSSPVAVEEALKTLNAVQVPGKKFAILGDMLELGSYSIEEHKKAGALAAKYADVLVAVGVRSRATADAALDAGMDDLNVLQFESPQEAAKYMESIIAAGDIILIKGSQVARMERAVKEIMRFPDQAENVLVRQDAAWLALK